MRYNVLGLIGAAACAVSVPMAWIPFLFGTAVIPSTHLDTLISNLCLLYFVAVILSFFTPLASLILVPVTAFVGTTQFWYYPGYSSHEFGWMANLVYTGYVIGLVGTALLFASIFVQVTRRGREYWDAPYARLRTWLPEPGTGTPAGTSDGVFSLRIVNLPSDRKRLATIVASGIVVVCLTFLSLVTIPVSNITVYVVFDIHSYGTEIEAALYVDGEVVETETINDQADTFIQWRTTRGISAGSHVLGLDFANSTSLPLDGIVECERSVRVLPFMDEYEMMGFGVGFPLGAVKSESD